METDGKTKEERFRHELTDTKQSYSEVQEEYSALKDTNEQLCQQLVGHHDHVI